MKIGIQAWGSEGDIRPLIALAGGLRSAGHNVTLAVTDVNNHDYTALGNILDLKIIPVGNSYFLQETDTFKNIFYQMLQLQDPIKESKLNLSTFFDPVVEELYSASKRLCEENEIVIGNFLLHPLSLAAERFKRPFVSVFVYHSFIPSRYVAPYTVPNLGRWMNLLWWKLGNIMIDQNFKRDINRLREREGVPPVKGVQGCVWESKTLNLIAVSPQLCERQPDWGNHYKVCGFFNVPDHTEKWDIPDDLATFLRAGAAPVYITFGSMMKNAHDPDPQKNREITSLLIDAVHRAGCRAIIQSCWDEITGIPEYPNIYRITKAPHHKIFKHCSVIVHHGGSGTTQTSVRCGRPSVVVAHIADQPFWGSELHRLSISPKVLYRRSLTPKKLAKAIRTVLDSPAMGENAERVGERMRKEDGVGQAVELINNIRTH